MLRINFKRKKYFILSNFRNSLKFPESLDIEFSQFSQWNWSIEFFGKLETGAREQSIGAKIWKLIAFGVEFEGIEKPVSFKLRFKKKWDWKQCGEFIVLQKRDSKNALTEITSLDISNNNLGSDSQNLRFFGEIISGLQKVNTLRLVLDGN